MASNPPHSHTPSSVSAETIQSKQKKKQLAEMKGGCCVLIALMVVVAAAVLVQPGFAVTCGQVETSLAPCMPYLTGGGNPAAACCNGIQNLKNLTPATSDRRDACRCVKAAASKFQNIKEDAASALPDKCGVQIGIPISMSTNCDQSVFLVFPFL